MTIYVCAETFIGSRCGPSLSDHMILDIGCASLRGPHSDSATADFTSQAPLSRRSWTSTSFPGHWPPNVHGSTRPKGVPTRAYREISRRICTSCCYVSGSRLLWQTPWRRLMCAATMSRSVMNSLPHSPSRALNVHGAPASLYSSHTFARGVFSLSTTCSQKGPLLTVLS